MSEYWKSTPKYWCNHCKTFVRDTKLEKQNHEASPKHQGNLKRFLRDLHKDHERGEREKQRAKDEVERLNNVVSGTTARSSDGHFPPWRHNSAIAPVAPTERQLTAERRQQIAQLAELGVAIPDEFRGEMAMAGEWQTISERVIKQQGDEDIKLDAHSIGVRKRKAPGEETDEEDASLDKKKGWGSTIKTYPEARKDTHDLDSLLKKALRKGKDKIGQPPTASGMENDLETGPAPTGEELSIKREDSEEDVKGLRPPLEESPKSDVAVKVEEPFGGGVVFKKRKIKNIRQK